MINTLKKIIDVLFVRKFLILKFRMKNHSRVQINSKVNSKTFLGGKNILGKGSYLNTQIGFGSFVGGGKLNNCCIGKFCSVGFGFSALSATHPIENVSTYPGFFDTSNKGIFLAHSHIHFDEYKKCSDGHTCIIGNDVWIGDNVSVIGGVTIGDGAVVGANALVTKDVKPYEIVGGVPAKVIRYRFNQEIIDGLMKIKWWNWDLAKIKDESEYFDNPEEFVKRNLANK